MVNISERPAKSILNRMKTIDSWFWCRYTLNPYQGCEHACVYCDARSDRYYLHSDFEETIVYKNNAPTLLDQKLSTSRTFLPDVIAMAGMCDAYQPLENTKQLTRSLLQVIHKHQYPIFISTKSTLIEKDGEILEEIGKQTKAVVAFTITTLDEALASFLEPKASTPWDRLKTLTHFAKQYPHITVGVNFMPIIPLFEDSKDQIGQVVQESADAGAQFLLFSPGVSLRDKQGDFFMQKLKQFCVRTNQLARFHRFDQTFGLGKDMPSSYVIQQNSLILNQCQSNNLPTRIQRWIPTDFRKQNYLAAEALLHQDYKLKMQNRPDTSLFWAAQAIHNLPDSLSNIKARNRLKHYLSLTPRIWELVAPYISSPTNLDRFLFNT